MNKTNVIQHVAEEARLTGPAAEADVNSMLTYVVGSLARGEAVSLLGFGTRSRPAGTGRNPRTGETLEISASTVATFKAGKPLRNAVNVGGS